MPITIYPSTQYGGDITGAGTGTAGTLVKFASSNTVANSIVTESGTVITITNTAAVPTVVGGSAANSVLTLQSTSGVGTTDHIKFVVGNNGATEAMRVINSGRVGVGLVAPNESLDVLGQIRVQGALGQYYSIYGTGTIDTRGASQPLTFLMGGSEKARITSTGNVLIGTTTDDGANKLQVNGGARLLIAPVATANRGTLSIGSGPFDGSTTGKFAGSASGTSIAVNEAAGYAGNLLDLQVGGVSVAKITGAGELHANGGLITATFATSTGTTARKLIALDSFGSGKLFLTGENAGYFLGAGADASNPDVGFTRIAAGVVAVGMGTTGSVAGTIRASEFHSAGANGQMVAALKQITELMPISTALGTSSSIQIPAGVLVLAVSARVTTAIPTATTFTITGASSSTVFNTAAISTAAGSTDKGTAAGCYYNAGVQNLTVTCDTNPGDETGRVRITIHYIEVTPPTS